MNDRVIQVVWKTVEVQSISRKIAKAIAVLRTLQDRKLKGLNFLHQIWWGDAVTKKRRLCILSLLETPRLLTFIDECFSMPGLHPTNVSCDFLAQALQMSVLKPRASRQFRIHVGPSGSNIQGLQNLTSAVAVTASAYAWRLFGMWIADFFEALLKKDKPCCALHRIVLQASRLTLLPLRNSSEGRDEFDVLVQVVRGQALISRLLELLE